MTANEALMTPGGTVRIGDRALTVLKLPARAEYGLGVAMAAACKESFGPGGYFQRAAKALAWLREQKMQAEWSVAVRSITEMEGLGSMPDAAAVEEFRQSPKGVALELFHRTRQTHPEVTLSELESVVTAANAPEVYQQIQQAVADEGNGTRST